MTSTTRGMDSVTEAIERIAAGEMVIVVDDDDRENEGDLVIAAEKTTPEAINFMATHGRGLICAPMLASRLSTLDIAPMVAHNTDPRGTAFHVGVDLRHGTSTGISAADRAATIRALADPASRAGDFTRPGHVFPLAYAEGGVLRRAGHTEASVDLAIAAQLRPASVICEIANADGTMARMDDLRHLSAEHGIPIVTIRDLIAYRRAEDQLVRRVSEARMPLRQAEFRAIAFRDQVGGEDHLALVLGDIATGEPPLVRMHSECLTGDVLGSRRCDCGAQLNLALDVIAEQGRGVVVYLRGHEGRGIGLASKLKAYELQDEGLDTYDANLRLGHAADPRDYGIGAHILRQLGVRRMWLLTNNPAKRAGLEGYGLEVVDRIPLKVAPTDENVRYLATKQQRLGHLLDLPLSEAGS